MQKIIRATTRAKTQARRRMAAEKAKDTIIDRVMRRQQEKMVREDIRQRVHAERSARREDWVLGPLAPRRDVGEMKEAYGTVSIRQLRGVEKADGRWKDWCIREGDRVVVVGAKQKDRGKIGVIKDLNEKAEECLIPGFNMVDVKTPDHLLFSDPNKAPTRTTEASIPLSDVRLVYPLPDPETGALRDVIIKELKRLQKNGPRYIAGLEPRTRIPFPPRLKPEYEDQDIDTLRIEVEESTWTPTLIRPPMPGSVIDELRNKYSVFRDRHDDSFVEALERRAAKREAAANKKVVRMRTPLEELHRKERKERKEKTKKEGQKGLDEETMRGIGELIARRKGISVEKEGVI